MIVGMLTTMSQNAYDRGMAAAAEEPRNTPEDPSTYQQGFAGVSTRA